MSGYVFALLFGILTSALIFLLLRSRHLREKYAAVWVVVAVLVLVAAVFPDLLAGLAHAFGIRTPVNLVFFVGALVILLIAVQLSVEVSRMEDGVRVLAEEVAILRAHEERIVAELDLLRQGRDAGPGPVPDPQPRGDS